MPGESINWNGAWLRTDGYGLQSHQLAQRLGHRRIDVLKPDAELQPAVHRQPDDLPAQRFILERDACVLGICPLAFAVSKTDTVTKNSMRRYCCTLIDPSN